MMAQWFHWCSNGDGSDERLNRSPLVDAQVIPSLAMAFEPYQTADAVTQHRRLELRGRRRLAMMMVMTTITSGADGQLLDQDDAVYHEEWMGLVGPTP